LTTTDSMLGSLHAPLLQILSLLHVAPGLQFPYDMATEVMEVDELVNLEIGPLPQYQFLEQVYRMPLIIQLAALLPSLTKTPFLLGEHKVCGGSAALPGRANRCFMPPSIYLSGL